ncbi:hypothetical protein BH09SUM1_BH09SUM1_02570 [soil metagenome]
MPLLAFPYRSRSLWALAAVFFWTAFSAAAHAGLPEVPPTFTSTPITETFAGDPYDYEITTNDANLLDTITITTSDTLPIWLSLTDRGDRTATLAGTPLATDVGETSITLLVSDQIASPTLQSFLLTAFPQRLVVDTLTDNDNGDYRPGDLSLREAIRLANDTMLDDITFATSGTIVIRPRGLPRITSTMSIDASSGAGGSCAPTIELDGTAVTGNGLDIQADGVLIKGLAINRFGANGIQIDGNDNAVECSFLGTDITGSFALPNGGRGVFVASGDRNIIGNSSDFSQNVLSGNIIAGVESSQLTTGTLVFRNMIGVNAAGDAAIPNGSYGVVLNGRDAFVGNFHLPNRNVISGNTGVAVVVNGDYNAVQTNIIGTDVNRAFAIPNTRGIIVNGAHNVIGADDARGNKISGNTGAAIEIFSGSASQNRFEQNSIGVDSTGLAGIPNGSGIFIPDTGDGNVIVNNVIAFNIADGIRSTASETALLQITGNIVHDNGGSGITFSGPVQSHKITRNSIRDNGQLGIDLNEDGVTLNDADDVDSGANALQNFPVLNIPIDGDAQLTGTLDSTASTSCTIELFQNAACDPSGYGEGQSYIGAVNVFTDPTGHASFAFSPFQPIFAGNVYTSTATDSAGRTSEFSACAIVPGLVVNHAPTDIALSNDSIPENTPPGSVVGVLSTIDPDFGDTVTLSLTNNAGGRFSISGTDLIANPSFNYEFDATSYLITVRASDAGRLAYSEDFTIFITDVNERPTEILISNAAVSEHAPNNTEVGVLTTLDEDTSQTHSYILLYDESGGAFQIQGDRVVMVDHDKLDYETDKEIDLFIRTADSGIPELSLTQYIKIDVQDDFDAPILIRNFPMIVPRYGSNTINTTRLQARDNDTADVSVFFYITSLPAQGNLYRDNVQMGVGSLFTQLDINTNLITYTHTTRLALQIDKFDFVYTDQFTGTMGPQSFIFNITLTNTPPVLEPATPLSVPLEGSVALPPASFTITDSEEALSDLAYLIDIAPTHGYLKRRGARIGAGDFFTQQDVSDGTVIYVNETVGIENGDIVRFHYTDNVIPTPLGAVDFFINVTTPGDTSPILNGASLLSATVSKGNVVTITRKMLEVLDSEQGPDQIHYTFVTLPTAGDVNLATHTKQLMVVGDTFTQEDINNGNLVYAHYSGSETTDGFSVMYDDGINAPQGPVPFSITITTPMAARDWMSYE